MTENIYKDGFDFTAIFEKIKKPMFFLGIAILFVIILMALISMADAFKQKPLDARFSSDKIKPSGLAALYVAVANNEEIDAKNAAITVEALDKKSLSVTPAKVTLPTLEKGGKRTLEFAVNPVGEIFPGTYLLKIVFGINGKIYEKEITLTVEE